MKTQVKKLMLLAALFLCCSYLKAQQIVDTSFYHQMNYTFGNLDKSKVPFGILKDFGMEFGNLQYYNGTNMADSTALNKRLFFDIYKTLFTAKVTAAASTTLPDPGAIDSIWYIKSKPGFVPLSGLFYQYAYLDKNAYANNQIAITNNQLFDAYSGGVWQNPYVNAKAIGFAPTADVYMGKNFNILLPDSLWLSNSKNIVDHIEIDVADGLGYRILTTNTPLLINYADTGLKVWNFKLYLTDNSVLQSHTKIQINADDYHQNDLPVTGGGLSTFSVTPIGTPISGPPTFFHVISSETFQGNNAYGFATVQYAPGHTGIVKPFIVAEGFDPGILTQPVNPIGEYSLNDFLGFVKKNATLIDLLKNDYDIVFIDYHNGIADIRQNALVVKEVIRWVNQQKALNGSTEHNVIMGQSMGGPLVRYALKKMENAGETHDVRLYISDDGAQQGANVPTGFQYLINHANNAIVQVGLANVFTAVVKMAYGRALLLKETPAAQQLIINYINSGGSYSNSVHSAWQTELTNLGYPSQGGIRNIAISNGSECGQMQDVGPNGILFKYDSTNQLGFWGSLGDFGASFLSLFTNHRRWSGLLLSDTKYISDFQVNASATNGGMQVYHGNINYSKHIFFFNITGTLTDDTENGPPGVLAYDSFPGSYFNEGAQSYVPTGGATVIGPFHFCAITTPSALDLGGTSSALAQSDYLKPYGFANAPVAPKNTPFANFITARDGGPNNEQHISFETRNGNWLADELNGVHTVADCSLACATQTISGPDHFCGATPVVYSIAGVPANANITWSVSGSAVINGTSIGNQISVSSTVAFGQQGFVTITAVLHSTCGDVTLVKNNVPTGILDLPAIDGPSEICILDRGNRYTVDAPEATGLPTWTMSPAPADFHPFTGLQLDLRTSHTGNYFLIVTVPTACGNEQQSMAITVDPCLPEPSFVAFPNPAGSTMKITSSGKTSSNASLSVADVASSKTPFTYKIYDDKGKVWREGSSEKGDDIDVDVRGLPNKTYFLHITANKKTIVKQIIVHH